MEQVNRWDAFGDGDLETILFAFDVYATEYAIQNEDIDLWVEIKAELDKRKGA